MEPSRQPSTRGRPRTITHERIAEAGIQIGMQNITFVGVAAALGVSHMALYKHVPNLEALKRLVAQEMFNRWEIPEATDHRQEGLKDYLLVFAASIQRCVKLYPGLTPYMIHRPAATQSTLQKIDDHHSHIAQIYGLQKEQARWLLSTIAFHCFSVADTVYSIVRQDAVSDESEMEKEIMQGMKALIVGALVMLENNTYLEQ